jgi:iron complex transport system permease protein
MTKKQKFTVLGLLLVLLVFMSLYLGSVKIGIGELFQILSGADLDKSFVIWKLRMPKTFLAILSGISLALSGLYMQSVFRNPLAGPYVLGISSGSSLGVALVILGASLFGGIRLNLIANLSISFAAFVGAFLVLGLVLIASRWIKDSLSILIIGLMMGSFSSAIVALMSYFSPAENLKKYLIWGMGNLSGVSEQMLLLVLISTVIGLGIGLYSTKGLNAFILGDTAAQSIGISIEKHRNLLFIATCLMTGSVTAAAGPIAFIGLSIPHISRIIFKSSDHRTLIPATILLGAISLLFCDIVASVPGSSIILPINSISSLIGAPIVIYLMLKKNKLVL